MRSSLQAVALLAAAHGAAASFSRNLAYSSPSRRHAELGVSLSERLAKRQDQDLYTADEVEFTHGIASGDPFPDSIILWTRLSPSENNTASDIVPGGLVPIYEDGNSTEPTDQKVACVEFQIATDEALTDVVDSGRAYTSSEVDFTVKFEAQNLSPFTTYWYRFSVCDSSPAKTTETGRTKTIHSADTTIPEADLPLRFAVYSCACYEEGYFNAYGGPVRKDSVDYIVHLGDYMYEYETYDSSVVDDRTPQPERECYSLYDYRRRLATYRTDEDLLASHQQFPWITTWDDHEVADNSYKNGSTDSSGQVFADRKKAAVRAYFEWMPIRQADHDDSLRVWRNFAFGNLLDLTMLDTRQYDRDLTVLGGFDGIGGNSDEVEEQIGWENRTIMGFDQEAWLYDTLRSSQSRGAGWRVIGNQVVFSHLTLGLPFTDNMTFNWDAWDGYIANRDRLYAVLRDSEIQNTVMLSGDSHAAWVSDMAWLPDLQDTYDGDSGEGGSFGVEFGGSAVTSPSPAGSLTPALAKNTASKELVWKNPELQWQDLVYRGYFEMSFRYEDMNATFFGIPDLKTRNDDEVELATFLVRSGENKLARNPTVGGGTARSGALKNGDVVKA